MQITGEGHTGRTRAQAEDPAVLRSPHSTAWTWPAKLAEILELEFACKQVGELASPVDAVYDPTGLPSGTDEGWGPT